MLDAQVAELSVVAVQMRRQMDDIIASNCSFYELRQVVTQLRNQFPRVSLTGPFLYPDQAEVGIELSVYQEQLEVRTDASQRMLKDNELGW
jgi:hypothetical protein